ncbi:hypothetical protein K466DRAFT_226759 [Polyporus arcularius HHB13444]|uniref:Uncharacterized protein n=1 Tax=Polyporus arcularius HHB13444 TaxID=1314778 RepID=A0A5C3P697_9APHY|nr:hypothetical protein K466DRAFT_226759 [Polyporus arcularius HHB13444]
MPEYAEVFACAHTIRRWFDQQKTAGVSLQLQRIWIDATDKERKAAPPGTDAAEGLVYSIDASCDKKRGSRSAQKPVWPHDADGKPLQEEEVYQLVLRDVTSTPRTVGLHFGCVGLQLHIRSSSLRSPHPVGNRSHPYSCFLSPQVHLQTHCTAQVFTYEQFHHEVRRVDCKVRGFRIPLALDFGAYIVTFTSLDNLCTPMWYKYALDDSHRVYIDAFDAHLPFLTRVAEYVRGLFFAKNPKNGEWKLRKTPAAANALATTVIREALKSVFGGVGVYTVLEIFYRAGLSPSHTAAEVFMCASRTARLCEAFWTLTYEVNTELRQFLEANYFGYVLAPTPEERLRYSYRLHVFGKRRTKLSIRMKDLWLEHERILEAYAADGRGSAIRTSDIGLYDVFEPTLIKAALTKPLNLGHLIFGEAEWAALSGTEAPSMVDPLTAVFHEVWSAGKARTLTNLKVAAYYEEGLFLHSRELERRWVHTRLYRPLGSQKAVWCITSQFPPALVPPHLSTKAGAKWGSQPGFILADADERDKETFEYVIHNTRSVVVGPLEFCGIGRLHFRGGAANVQAKFSGNHKQMKYKLAVCAASPVLSEAQARREKASNLRKIQGRHKDGASKAASNKASCSGGWHKRGEESVAKDEHPA